MRVCLGRVKKEKEHAEYVIYIRYYINKFQRALINLDEIYNPNYTFDPSLLPILLIEKYWRRWELDLMRYALPLTKTLLCNL